MLHAPLLLFGLHGSEASIVFRDFARGKRFIQLRKNGKEQRLTTDMADANGLQRALKPTGGPPVPAARNHIGQNWVFDFVFQLRHHCSRITGLYPGRQLL